jgi:DNA-3-methyladenine glycosylase II
MFSISVNQPFSFDQIYRSLAKQADECLFYCEKNQLYRALIIQQKMTIFSVSWANELRVSVLNRSISASEEAELRHVVAGWLGIDCCLADFYTFAKEDELLEPLTQRFYGLPIIGLPNVFEAFAWAIIGQQINLTFAHKVKEQFVATFGQIYTWENKDYYIFPEPAVIASLSIDKLKTIQLSKQKATYLIEVARFLLENKIDFTTKSYSELLALFIEIKGIGSWTANYVLMKTFHFPEAFPHLDVGLHNAIKALRGLDAKPTAAETLELGERWGEWKAYATAYLWRALADI